MRKFLSQRSDSILVFIHSALMLLAFIGFLVLFSVYIYDWYRDSLKIREDIAYEKVGSVIKRTLGFKFLFDTLIEADQYGSSLLFLQRAKQWMVQNTDINSITKISLNEKDVVFDEVSLRRDNKNAFYFPVSVLNATRSNETNRMIFRDYYTLYNFKIGYKPSQWSSSLNVYKERRPYVYKATENIKFRIVFSERERVAKKMVMYRSVISNTQKIIIVIDIDSNFVNQSLIKALGDDFQFFLIRDGKNYVFEKGGLLDTLKFSNEDLIKGIKKFNYAGTDYVLSYHELFTVTGVGVVAPASVYYSFNKPINYSMLILLMLAMMASGSLATYYFWRFRKNAHDYVNTILSNQQKSSTGLGIKHDIDHIRENFAVLNRYMPNNFRSFKLGSMKDQKVVRQEICIMFIQVEKLEQNKDFNWNKMYQSIIPCIIGTGGVIDKLMGDIVLAVWLNKPDHALAVDACKAALAIEKRFKDTSVNVHIGINIGTCDVGSYGDEDRAEYTISGSPVNLTSRICKITKAYGTPILLSEYVVDCLDQVYPTCFVDAVIAPKTRKGFRIYALLSGSKNAMQLAIQPGDIQEFTKAFNLYQNARWQEALILFQKIEKKHPENPIIKTFIARIKTLPIPQNWQGYWQL